MAKFRDNATGNIFVFESDYDIQSLRKHPDYTEVIEEEVKEKKPSKKTKQVEEQ